MNALTVTDTPFLIEGPAGSLELVTMAPRAPVPAGVAVLCHPHPLMGGTMHNKVVHTLARAHRDTGHLAVRFNFRGVGASSGIHDQGRGEIDDLVAVARWAREQCPEGPFYLAGFSFGAWVAARALDRLAAEGLVPRHVHLIAPPVHHFGFDALTDFPAPVTIVMGDDDEVVPPADVHAWTARIASACTLHRMAGAGHFFHGRLNDLKTLVESSIK